MKKADFKQGAKGFVYSFTRETSPTDTYIHEVEIEHVEDKYGYAWDFPNEQSIYVEPKDVFYTYEEAKKALLRFLSKMHQKFMKEVEA